MNRFQVSRRSFLAGGVKLTALGSLTTGFAPSLATAAMRASTAKDDRILVVVQLTGGNDGLNTVVPHGQDAYYRMRPTLGQKPGAIHKLDEHIALHPELGGLAELYREGALTIAHGVGHPGADRSHFRSLEIWHTAEPFAPVGRVGWLGHMSDQLLAQAPGSLPALSVGGRGAVLAMRGANAIPPTVPDDRGFTLAFTSKQIAKERAKLAAEERGTGGDLGFLRQTARTSYRAAERMATLTKDESKAAYPDIPLGKELRLVAQLIRGGFGTRVFHVTLGGFDTHASQAPVHDPLLRKLGSALSAFQADLKASGDDKRAVTMVFSEFGRRAKENGSRGTDHGRANPVLFLGTSLCGGQVGERPDLETLVKGDVPETMDFRGLYRQVEEDWMGLKRFASERIDAPAIF